MFWQSALFYSCGTLAGVVVYLMKKCDGIGLWISLYVSFLGCNKLRPACQGHPHIADMLGSEMGTRGEDAKLGLPLGLRRSHCPHRLSLQVIYILIYCILRNYCQCPCR